MGPLSARSSTLQALSRGSSAVLCAAADASEAAQAGLVALLLLGEALAQPTAVSVAVADRGSASEGEWEPFGVVLVARLPVAAAGPAGQVLAPRGQGLGGALVPAAQHSFPGDDAHGGAPAAEAAAELRAALDELAVTEDLVLASAGGSDMRTAASVLCERLGV